MSLPENQNKKKQPRKMEHEAAPPSYVHAVGEAKSEAKDDISASPSKVMTAIEVCDFFYSGVIGP